MPATATDSILTKTKKLLGIEESYTAFDVDIVTHINSAFSQLQQLGIGPDDGFEIEDDAPVWSDYLQDKKHLNVVKSFVYDTVRLYFDPPQTSFALDAIKNRIAENQWRLSLYSPPADYTVVTPGT